MRFFILFLFGFTKTFSQSYISLDSAIQIGMQNNLQIKNEQLRMQYFQKLKASAISLENTTINLDYGQFNSIYKDNRINISQNISFPTVFIAQNKMYNAEIKKSLFNNQLKNKEIVKNISTLFYTYLILKEKEKLLKESDSFYTEFIIKANIRFKQGESTVLEKITAETQQGQIKIQLQQLVQEIEIVLLQFQILLNIDVIYMPSAALKIEHTALKDNIDLSHHPLLQSLFQDIQIQSALNKVEKNKLLPNLILGYSNSTIQGFGADNKEYQRSNRFQSVQIGLGIPLFFNTQKAKIKASQIQQQIAQNNYEWNYNSLQNAVKIAKKQYQQTEAILSYYENVATVNAENTINVAKQQFINGEIDYIQWVFLMNQAIGIKNEYLNNMLNYNKSIIELNYLNN